MAILHHHLFLHACHGQWPTLLIPVLQYWYHRRSTHPRVTRPARPTGIAIATRVAAVWVHVSTIYPWISTRHASCGLWVELLSISTHPSMGRSMGTHEVPRHASMHALFMHVHARHATGTGIGRHVLHTDVHFSSMLPLHVDYTCPRIYS